MTIAWGSALSKTHFDADTDDPSQARAELEAMVDRINTKLANQTLLQLSDKTGNDSGIVSGTAGTDGNLVQWNADGDVVDGPDVLDEDDMASDSASAVPTQQSTRAYADTKARIKTGTYTGDGTTSQSITGVGFQPVYVKIWVRATSDGTAINLTETTDTIIDDTISGGSVFHFGAGGHSVENDTIISLDSDGFTVDDAGGDNHPNENGLLYNYMAIG